MNYVGTKYSAAEAEAIMATARANVRQQDEALRQRAGSSERFVTKTTDNAARVEPAPESLPAIDPQTASWVAWVDARIDEKFETFRQVLDKLLDNLNGTFDSIEAAFARRDHAIETLRNELELKLTLSRKVERLKGEVEAARERQPNFESELVGLRSEIERQKKVISRLRGEASELRYAQTQLDAKQQQSYRQLKMTEVEVTSFGSATRELLQRLHENGFDIVDEMPAQSRWAS